MPELRDDALRALFAQLVASPHFVRAPMQVRALSVLIEAAIGDETLSGRVLADRLYGKADRAYIRAAQQVVRELRVKIAKTNADRLPGEARIEIPESGYQVFVVRGAPQESGSTPLTTSVTQLPPRRRAALAIAALAVSIVILTAVGLLSSRSSEGRLDHVTVRDAELHAFDREDTPLVEWEAAIRRARLVPRDDGSAIGDVPPSARAAFVERRGSASDLAVLSCDAHSEYACRIVILDGSTRSVRETADLPFFAFRGSRPRLLHEQGGEDLPPWFVTAGLVAADLDGDGKRDELVATVRQQRSFPCAVIGLDPADSWKVLFEYWSMGEVAPYTFSDQDGDGVDEVLLYGTNNSTWSGYAVLLPPVAEIRGLEMRTPGGSRLALLAETSELPEAGLALRFPTTVFASPQFPEFGSARGKIDGATWDPSGRKLTLVQQDGARVGATGEWFKLEFDLDFDAGCGAVRFLSYDRYLAEFRKAIAAGRITDRWNIGSLMKLETYGVELKARVQWCDPARGVLWTDRGLGDALRRRLQGTQKVSMR